MTHTIQIASLGDGFEAGGGAHVLFKENKQKSERLESGGRDCGLDHRPASVIVQVLFKRKFIGLHVRLAFVPTPQSETLARRRNQPDARGAADM